MSVAQSMDFFGHQDAARRRTAWLVFYYGLAVAGIVVALYAVVVLLYGMAGEGRAPVGFWQPDLFLWVAGGVVAVVVCGTLVRMAQLSQGGVAVARALGGVPVSPGTTNPEERRLLNVVEEMALAAGVAVPQVFVLAEETGINAFAAGFSPRDAVIGVTRGCMQQLNRDELQGVIAHEFSHIVNGDMRLNVRLMGVLFGILMLTVIGRILLRTAYFGSGRRRSSRDGKKGGNPLPILGLAMIVIGYIGVFFASLIKSAVSRQREFLADASAVQYTRNPSGIAGALRKIAGHTARVQTPNAAEASHLFFGEAVGRGLAGLFTTHPPLAERIRRLDPSANPEIARLAAMPSRAATATAAMAPGSVGAAAAVPGFAPAGAGTVDLAAASSVLGGLPDALLKSVRDPVGARAAVYALLWSNDAAVQAVQRRAMTSDPAAAAAMAALTAKVRSLAAASRLPLVELAIPTLKTLERGEYATFRQVLGALIEADESMDLFEYALHHMVLRHLEPAFGKTSTAPVRYRTVESVLPHCATLLSALAVWGTDSPAAAAACYGAGMAALTDRAPALEPGKASLAAVDEALETLGAAAPLVKRRIIEACTACVLADGRVAPRQGELLRAVADSLDVPMPPMAA